MAGLGYAMWPEQEAAEKVRTDPAPLNRRFSAALGDVSDAHWLGYDTDESTNDRSIPSPDSRIRLVGVARLEQGTAHRTFRFDGVRDLVYFDYVFPYT